ncbi:PREDICTED: probable inactive shikimate kinase like 1, chloroplastic isoform X2 [Nelumbo nucifera]|uniref:Probable inactive shikimate kinase like 1, chloroplastic isoform X2 n=1 Tax=Nelumbo nucifera TaxID=4432 RepID=A0A1U7ZME6_NELNU|nr:PREDICTED: probable inactive shikimate kinase like 1, chloroplastic isoform X2 [Nelumbo nucifera]
MEMSLIHSSCRNLQFCCSKFIQFRFEGGGGRSSLISPLFTKVGSFHSLQTTTTSISTETTTSMLRRPATKKISSSLRDQHEISGTTANVVELDPSLPVKKKAIQILPELKGTSIFLVGINNIMKYSLGKLLSDALRYYYFDSDSLVEQAAGGESSAKSFKERDEEGFRNSETEVLKQLSSMGRLVVCAGDGAVQSSTNLAFLRHGISIWVDIPLDLVAREVTENASSEILANLTKLYEEMREGYATADATVSLQKVASQLGYDNMAAVTVEDMAMEVLREIEKLTRMKKMMEAAGRPF